jgi:late competence protein required for DNA uptake (superfamily II DNA/RNA helicase)
VQLSNNLKAKFIKYSPPSKMQKDSKMRCAECGTRTIDLVTVQHMDGTTEKYCRSCAIETGYLGKEKELPIEPEKFVLS